MRILVGLLVFLAAFQVEAKAGSSDPMAYKHNRFHMFCEDAANRIMSANKGDVVGTHDKEAQAFCKKQEDAYSEADWKTMLNVAERGCLTAFANLVPKEVPKEVVAKDADNVCHRAVLTDHRTHDTDVRIIAKYK